MQPLTIQAPVLAAGSRPGLLCRHVRGRDSSELREVIRAGKPKHLPVVVTRDELKAVVNHPAGDKWLTGSLMPCAGLPRMESLRLRVRDIDLAGVEVTVRGGKGAKDRPTVLSESLKRPLRDHLGKLKAVHEQDVAEGPGRVQTPHAPDRKYPRAPAEWRREWGFPQGNSRKDL
ncbi:MAG: hypothetical protein QHJ34_12435, partial [bacterium]|nr:hypothetical protein [bacterium]